MQSRQDCVLWFQLSALTACCSSTRIMCTQNTDISFDCRGIRAVSLQAAHATLSLPFPGGVLRSRCRFSGSLPMCQWIDMQMPRTWYWKCRRHFYIHSRGMCIFIHVCFVITAALRTGCYPCTHPHTLTNWKSI